MDIIVNPERDLVAMLRRRHLVDVALLDAATRGGDDAQALDTLVGQGMVRADQLRRMLKTLGRVVGTCFTCLKRIQIPVAQWDGTFFCEHCYERRSLAQGTGGQVGDLLLDPASRLLDEYMLKALVKLGHVNTDQISAARKVRSKRVPRPTVCRVLMEEKTVPALGVAEARAQALGELRGKFPHLDGLRADQAAAKRLLRSSLVSQDGLLTALKMQYDKALKEATYIPLDQAIGENELTEYQRQVLLPRIVAGEAGEDAQIEAAQPAAPPIPPAPAAPPPAPEPPTAAPEPAPAPEPPAPAPEPPAPAPEPPAPEPAAEPPQAAVAPTTVVAFDDEDDAAEVEDIQDGQDDGEPDEPSAPKVASPRKGIGHGYAVGDVNVQRIGGLTSGIRRMQVKILRPEGQMPKQAAQGDAGMDLHAIETITIEPGAIARIPLGFATAFPPDLVGLVRDRSSMAARGLHTLGGVIDSSYRGEWIVLLNNLGANPQTIEAGDRVAQVVFVRLGTMVVLPADELPETERGEGGFGSSGR